MNQHPVIMANLLNLTHTTFQQMNGKSVAQ
jgi:hypothetical protein